jgi:hypothetical protein
MTDAPHCAACPLPADRTCPNAGRVHRDGRTWCETYHEAKRNGTAKTEPHRAARIEAHLDNLIPWRAKIRECPHRQPADNQNRPGCGCDAFCTAGKSRKPNGAVGYHDCRACLEADGITIG